MKLNQDCVRDTLLFIESDLQFGEFFHLDDFYESSKLKKYNHDTIKYTLGKLSETEYLHATPTWMNNDLTRFSTGMLTWEGHQFLDTIRDNKVWSKTKSITSKFSSVSISTLQAVSGQVIAALIKNSLNIP